MASKALKKRRARAVGKKLSLAGSLVPNPVKEQLEVVLPAFGAYAATRFIQRMAYVQVTKKWPKLGKHAPVAASAVAVAAAYYLPRKIKQLAPYESPLLIGTTIALLQSAVQTYLPAWGWVVGDVNPDQYKATAPAPRATADFEEEDGMDVTPSIAAFDVPRVQLIGDGGDDVYDEALGDSGDGLGADDLAFATADD